MALTHSCKRFTTGALGLVCLLVVLGAAAVIIANLRIRTDLTEQKLYTLSSGSRAILGKLPADVTLKFYLSRSSSELPRSIKAYADQVQDLLKEYEYAGKGRIVLEAYDPKPDSDAEEWAQRYGVEPQQVSMFGQPVYFGLVAVCGDHEETIPGFSPRKETTLEYDITRLITRVAWPEKPVIGVMSSLPVLGEPQNPMMMRRRSGGEGWMAFKELRKDYTVQEVPSDAAEIPAAVKALVVIHPKALSDKTLFAIDQFVLRGGRLIACVDPFSIADFQANAQNQQMMMMGGGAAGPSTLGKLFDAWGIGFNTEKLVADLGCATKLGGENGRVDENPVFLSLTGEYLSKDDLLTSQLSSLMFPFAGALTFKETKGLLFTPLVHSSKDNDCLVDAQTVQFGSAALRGQLKPDGVQRVIAGRLDGTFTTAFPNGYRDPAETNAAAKAAAPLKSGKSAVLIFGDTDFLVDQFCVQVSQTLFGDIAQAINDNLTLFGNAVEQFAGREELIGVRSRGRFNRPFKTVDAIEAAAAKKWTAEQETLEQKLQETQTRLSALQKQKSGSERAILSPAQQQEIEQFRKVQLETRKQLKAVRKSMNQDIERLGTELKVMNIILIPVLVIAFGIFHGMRRRNRH